MKIYYCDDAPTPWGDWGVALVRGSLAWDEDTDIRSIERVGPFTPLAYICSGAFILTHPIKEALESSDLTGISRYQHLEKTHIVRIDWQHWDDSKPITQYLDLDGGPSSIIDSLQHDTKLARQLPEYWRGFIAGRLKLSINSDKDPRDVSAYLRVLQADENTDFFKGDLYGGYFVSEKAKIWLERFCPECFNFPIIPTAK